MRCFLFQCVAALIVSLPPLQAMAAESIVVDLWSGTAPGDSSAPADDTVVAAKPKEDPPTLRLTDVTRPQIAVHRPMAGNKTGVAMLVIPGGGFNHLAYDKEGTEPAEWLANLGITGVVLKYRCPTKQDRDTQHIKPLQDAQRAMSILRSRADEWGIDVEQIGVLGFSAGGHLAARLSLHQGSREYPTGDAIDEQNWQPNFSALIYPAYLLNAENEGLDLSAFHVKPTSPPTFIAYSWDDKHPSPGALYLAIELQKAGVPCEVHQYATGGHAYGMRPVSTPDRAWPAVTWPDRLEDWLRQQGTLGSEPDDE